MRPQVPVLAFMFPSFFTSSFLPLLVFTFVFFTVVLHSLRFTPCPSYSLSLSLLPISSCLVYFLLLYEFQCCHKYQSTPFCCLHSSFPSSFPYHVVFLYNPFLFSFFVRHLFISPFFFQFQGNTSNSPRLLLPAFLSFSFILFCCLYSSLPPSFPCLSLIHILFLYNPSSLS